MSPTSHQGPLSMTRRTTPTPEQPPSREPSPSITRNLVLSPHPLSLTPHETSGPRKHPHSYDPVPFDAHPSWLRKDTSHVVYPRASAPGGYPRVGRSPIYPGRSRPERLAVLGDPARGACSRLHDMHPALHIQSDTRSAPRQGPWPYGRRLPGLQRRIT